MIGSRRHTARRHERMLCLAGHLHLLSGLGRITWTASGPTSAASPSMTNPSEA